jgi:thiopeptide-type bacteriocin biosynthesis protein
MDLLLDDLGLSLDAKRALTRRACSAYRQEFGVNGAFRQAMSRRFRDERPALEPLLDPHRQVPPELAQCMEALRWRSVAIAPVAAELRRLAERGRLSAPIEDLVLSYVHMHVNRLLRSAQRAQELVLYELLDRLYSSQAARGGR